MRSTKRLSRVLAVLLTFSLMLVLFSPSVLAAEGDITVYVSAENSTFPTSEGAAWDGILLDLVPVTVPAGTTVAEATSAAFTEHEIAQSGLPEYLTEIDGLSAGDAGVEVESEYGAYFADGWSFTLNDWFANEGASAISVEDGDEIRWSFSMSMGADLGSSWDNNSTALSALRFGDGSLSPAFDPEIFAYTLVLPLDLEGVAVIPTAANKNFQVRTQADETEYKRSRLVPVKEGTVIQVVCGDPAWPSMNESEGATTYTVTVTLADEAWVNSFEDVPEDSPFLRAIEFVCASGWMNGVSPVAFAPDRTLSNAMLATVLARIAGQDVSGGAVWYEPAMAWALEEGLMSAENPGDGVTYQRFADILALYGEKNGLAIPRADTNTEATPRLDDFVSRAEAASMFHSIFRP